MKLKELLKDIEVVELAASSDAEINGISYDSRKTTDGKGFEIIQKYIHIHSDSAIKTETIINFACFYNTFILKST